MTSNLFQYVLGFILIIPSFAWSQDAPVTYASAITNATPGNPSVPVTVQVDDFSNIGQFTLTMKFDTTRARFVSASPNSSLNGMTITYTPPVSNTQGKLIFSWTGASNTSLPDSTIIANLVFHYVTGTAILYWSYTFGSVCQYKSWVNGTLTPLNDNPKHLFYYNGGISNRSAPFTFAPVIAEPVEGPLPIPITVNSFSTIGGFTLYLEYDPLVITYLNTFTKNPVFGSAFQVGDNPGSDGKRIIIIQWYGGSVTLTDGSTLCTLNFSYPGANCEPTTLSWTDNGPSCEYSDNLGNVLIDLPQQNYYIDGIVASALYPTWTGSDDSNWYNPLNWNDCGVPDSTSQVFIPYLPSGATPIITSASYCRSLTVETQASLIIGATGVLTVGNTNIE